MPDDKSKVGEPDRSRVVADYEVSHLTETLSISSDEARKLIERYDRDKIYATAETLKLGWIA